VPAFRVLLIDDSADDAAALIRIVELGGYDVASECVHTAAALSSALARQSWDVVVADYTSAASTPSKAALV